MKIKSTTLGAPISIGNCVAVPLISCGATAAVDAPVTATAQASRRPGAEAHSTLARYRLAIERLHIDTSVLKKTSTRWLIISMQSWAQAEAA